MHEFKTTLDWLGTPPPKTSCLQNHFGPALVGWNGIGIEIAIRVSIPFLLSGAYVRLTFSTIKMEPCINSDHIPLVLNQARGLLPTSSAYNMLLMACLFILLLIPFDFFWSPRLCSCWRIIWQSWEGSTLTSLGISQRVWQPSEGYLRFSSFNLFRSQLLEMDCLLTGYELCILVTLKQKFAA